MSDARLPVRMQARCVVCVQVAKGKASQSRKVTHPGKRGVAGGKAFQLTLLRLLLSFFWVLSFLFRQVGKKAWFLPLVCVKSMRSDPFPVRWLVLFGRPKRHSLLKPESRYSA